MSLGKKPKDELVWYPYSDATIVYGYLTDLPGNVHFRITDDPGLIANFTKLMLDPNDPRYHVDKLVIISYYTEKRANQQTSHLHTNDFQIVFGYNDFSTWFIKLYHRIDSMFGISGINVPSCFTRQAKSMLGSRYMYANNDDSNAYWDVPPGVYVYDQRMIANMQCQANTG